MLRKSQLETALLKYLMNYFSKLFYKLLSCEDEVLKLELA
jgi:hypothetical protein